MNRKFFDVVARAHRRLADKARLVWGHRFVIGYDRRAPVSALYEVAFSVRISVALKVKEKCPLALRDLIGLGLLELTISSMKLAISPAAERLIWIPDPIEKSRDMPIMVWVIDNRVVSFRWNTRVGT